MDICQQLEAKYPKTFEKLIVIYQSLDLTSKEERQLKNLIDNLLKDDCWHGNAIQLYLKGHNLAEIGRRLNLSRERIRQVIERYKHYYHEVGSKDWCDIQVKKLLDSHPKTDILPSNEEIKNFHRKLLSALKEHYIGKKGSTLKEDASKSEISDSTYLSCKLHSLSRRIICFRLSSTPSARRNSSRKS